MIALKDGAHGISFAVRVQPRAGKTEIRGVFGEGEDAALRIALNAPPVDGRANEELVEHLAEILQVPRFAVDVIAGAQSRNKVVRVQGRTLREVRACLNSLLAVSR